MKILIPDNTKLKLIKAKFAIPNRLLATQDIERREKGEMSDIELIHCFDEIWNNRLRQAIETADKCNIKTVRSKLKPTSASYIDDSQEHKEYHLQSERLSLSFIVQLKPLSENEYELTQHWFIPSTDTTPQCIYVCFETLQEKNRFKEIATRLSYEDSDLALKLIRNFMDLTDVVKNKPSQVSNQ